MHWPFRRSKSEYVENALTAAPMEGTAARQVPKHPRWNFAEGALIAGHLTVLKRLGGGSANEVFLVWDDRLFALCVAKLLRPDRVDDVRSRRELAREVELLGRCAHPTLVRGFGAMLDGPHPHVLLELVEGPTLGRLIKREGALSLQQLLPTILHVGSVLQYLAREHVVHLDVKPGNIVMGIPPRLIDLSIARSTGEAVRLKTAIGTDAYMAPEQCDPLSRPGRLGPSADIWGLGATLYHATTGRLPFPRSDDWDKDKDSLHARFPQIQNDPAPVPKYLPPALSDVIMRMLSKDPEKRPTAADVVATLEPLVAEVTTPRRRRFGQ